MSSFCYGLRSAMNQEYNLYRTYRRLAATAPTCYTRKIMCRYACNALRQYRCIRSIYDRWCLLNN